MVTQNEPRRSRELVTIAVRSKPRSPSRRMPRRAPSAGLPGHSWSTAVEKRSCRNCEHIDGYSSIASQFPWQLGVAGEAFVVPPATRCVPSIWLAASRCRHPEGSRRAATAGRRTRYGPRRIMDNNASEWTPAAASTCDFRTILHSPSQSQIPVKQPVAEFTRQRSQVRYLSRPPRGNAFPESTASAACQRICQKLTGRVR